MLYGKKKKRKKIIYIEPLKNRSLQSALTDKTNSNSSLFTKYCKFSIKRHSFPCLFCYFAILIFEKYTGNIGKSIHTLVFKVLFCFLLSVKNLLHFMRHPNTNSDTITHVENKLTPLCKWILKTALFSLQLSFPLYISRWF